MQLLASALIQFHSILHTLDARVRKHIADYWSAVLEIV